MRLSGAGRVEITRWFFLTCLLLELDEEKNMVFSRQPLDKQFGRHSLVVSIPRQQFVAHFALLLRSPPTDQTPLLPRSFPSHPPEQ